MAIRLFLVCLLVAIAGCTPDKGPAFDGLVVETRDAPTAPFLGSNGQQVSLGDFKGEVLLVNYWATWCGPCEEELPSLGALQRAFVGQNFRIIALSVDDTGDLDYAKKRLNDLTEGSLAFHHLLPDDWRVYYETGARGFPTSIIIGANGVELARLEGSTDWSAEPVQAYITTLINQK